MTLAVTRRIGLVSHLIFLPISTRAALEGVRLQESLGGRHDAFGACIL